MCAKPTLLAGHTHNCLVNSDTHIIEYNLSFYALLHPEMALPLVGDAAHIAHKDRRNEGRMKEKLRVFSCTLHTYIRCKSLPSNTIHRKNH